MTAPVRTCIGCGERAPQGELARVRVLDGAVVLDPGRTGGRGAWLHARRACAERAGKRRAFGRALRAPAARVDVEGLAGVLTPYPRKD